MQRFVLHIVDDTEQWATIGGTISALVLLDEQCLHCFFEEASVICVSIVGRNVWRTFWRSSCHMCYTMILPLFLRRIIDHFINAIGCGSTELPVGHLQWSYKLDRNILVTFSSRCSKRHAGRPLRMPEIA